MNGIAAQRLHHNAVVVRDQEQTRAFYEDVLGMPPVATWCEVEHLRGKTRKYCHTFFALADGSALAFFQFADEDDYQELTASAPKSLNHIALRTDAAGQSELADRLGAAGVPHRTVEHGYCRSLYVVDPNGLTVEFTVDAGNADQINAARRADAHTELRRWLGGDHRPNNDLRHLDA
jgi:catechol 2,3-dioxygenase-like lactoylglutathione lyase family enzyme